MSHVSLVMKCIEIILPFKNSASIDNIVVKPTDKSSTVYVEKALHLLCIENTKQRMKCWNIVILSDENKESLAFVLKGCWIDMPAELLLFLEIYSVADIKNCPEPNIGFINWTTSVTPVVTVINLKIVFVHTDHVNRSLLIANYGLSRLCVARVTTTFWISWTECYWEIVKPCKGRKLIKVILHMLSLNNLNGLTKPILFLTELAQRTLLECVKCLLFSTVNFWITLRSPAKFEK